MDNKLNRVECPFYLRASKKAITCEGIEGGTQCTHSFENAYKKEKYVKEFCSHLNGRNCQYYRMLSSLYGWGIKK